MGRQWGFYQCRNVFSPRGHVDYLNKELFEIYFYSCGLITWDISLFVADPRMTKILYIYKFSKVFLHFFKKLQGTENYGALLQCPKSWVSPLLTSKRAGMFFLQISGTNWTQALLSILEGQGKAFWVPLSLSLSSPSQSPSKYWSGRWFQCDAPKVNRCEFWWNNKRIDLCRCLLKLSTWSAPNKQMVLQMADFKF